MQAKILADSFFGKYQSLVRDTMIPYQWAALNDAVADAPKSGAIANLKIAAGMQQGEFYGPCFQESDLYKWMEAAAYSLMTEPNAEIEKNIDYMASVLDRAQCVDGYLNAYITVTKVHPRFTNLKDEHELYCAGHFFEAAVAYYEATGKRNLLEIATKYADYLCGEFNTSRCKGYPGHPEIELALCKLAAVTGSKRYSDLAKYFVDMRGTEPNYFKEEIKRNGDSFTTEVQYYQAHIPVREQDKAIGHSVRACYLYAGMADVAAAYNDARLMETCKTLFDNIIERQIYITGAIGQTAHGEAFTLDYDLPINTLYGESCASIALVFFAKRMLTSDRQAKYADVMERVICNILLASMGQDGKHFLYVNPMSVTPGITDKNPSSRHTAIQRQPWFGCACCPPNIARLILSLQDYIYSHDDSGIYVDLYMASNASVETSNGSILLEQQTNYPFGGNIKINVAAANLSAPTAIMLRIPYWSEDYTVEVNGTPVRAQVENGYAKVEKAWQEGDTITISFEMKPRLNFAHNNARELAGKCAVSYGPVIYCIEQADNGALLDNITLCADKPITVKSDENGVTLKAHGLRKDNKNYSLYTFDKPTFSETSVALVPYYTWGNRGLGEMRVFMPYR